MSELPEGWVSCRLGDYARLKNGFAFKSTDFVKPSENTVPVIRISDIDGRSASDSDAVHIHSSAAIQGFEVKNGDLLIAMSGATTGKVGVYNGKEPAYQNQRVGNIKLLSNDDGCPSFRNHLIKSLSETILKSAYGGAQPNISGKAIEEIIISLPPLAEQKRIADKLDALLARVDGCRARLARVPVILKRFRQAVLAAATSGQLTADWREEDTTSGWDWERAEDVCEKVQSGGTPKEGFVESEGIPFLKVYNIVDQKVNFFYKPQFVTVNVHNGPLAKSRAKPGDVLMNIVGPPLGKVAIVPDDFPEWNINQAITLFRPSSRVITEWLYYFLCSGISIASVEHQTRGSAGQSNISLSQCRNFIFPVPPLEEQHEIIHRVEILFGYADRLAARYAAAAAQVEQLIPALLAKAFRGELVAQDPEDEPAAVLLARLRGA